MNSDDVIQTEPQPTCPLCHTPGRVRYQDLTDRLFGATGVWTLKECPAPVCGSLWLDPRPTLADVGKAYRSYYTHGGAGLARVVQWIVRAVAREHGAGRYGFSTSRLPGPGGRLVAALAALYPGLREHLDLLVRYTAASRKGGGRLLDVGCGDGQSLEILADLGWSVSGVEVDPSAVAVARARGLDVRQGTLADAAFAEDSFDLVTSSHVIEHVHDPADFLRQSLRVLRPGGGLVTVTPNAHAMLLEKHGASWLALDPPRHLLLFTASSLETLARAVGFRDITVRSTARAVALNEIASAQIEREGHYQWGQWPGLPLWLRAQAQQLWEPLAMRLGRAEGEELVLQAVK
jgi:SAM-dependent methyltransferase